MNKLEQARTNIDQIDKQMAKLFEQRMQEVENVINYKKEHNLQILDSSREKQVIQKNLKYIENIKYQPYYEKFIINTMNISKQYQNTLLTLPVIGYQGTLGSFSYICTNKLFKDHEKKSFISFEEVFKAVIEDKITYGVIPFENSYTGEVGDVLDLLKKYDVHITQTYDLKIDHNLLGIKKSKLEDIKQVYSHQQALSQCQLYFKDRNIELIPYSNTALAAKYISEKNDPTKGAIASKETAQLFNLEILSENINTSSSNTTRFIVISKHQNQVGNRISLLFTVKHEAGALANCMNIFSKYHLNLESIRSRSLKDQMFQYYFYVEFINSLDNCTNFLKELGQYCLDLKVIGLYNK